MIIVVLAVTGYFFITSNNPSPSEVFNRYLKKSVDLGNIAQEENYSGTGSQVNLKGSLDLSRKSFLALASLSCATKADNNDINMTMSLQIENASTFLRIDSASGNIKDVNGNAVDLSKAFSKIKGQWYKMDSSSDDPAVKAQLDSGVWISDDGIRAPGYDSQKVLNSLLDKNVFTIKSSTMNGDTYTINLELAKTSYNEALTEILPNLSNRDLVLESIFEDSQTSSINLVLSKNGTLKSEKNDSINLCVDLVKSFTGAEASDLAKRISGEVTPKPLGSIKIEKIQNSKPFSEYANDVVR